MVHIVDNVDRLEEGLQGLPYKADFGVFQVVFPSVSCVEVFH